MAAFGFVCFFGVASTRKSDSWHRNEKLLQTGKQTDARVTDRQTFQTGEETRANISYQYEINGKIHAGIAETNPSVYLEHPIGSTIRITYLPDNPGESDFSAQDWVDRELATEKIGIVLIASGLTLTIILALLDCRRKLFSVRQQVIQDGNTYYLKSIICVLGILFSGAGILCQVAMIEQVTSATPFVLSVNGVPEIAGPIQKGLVLLFAVPFWVIGAIALVYWKAFSITTSPEGVSVTLPFGKSWKASWQDVKLIRREADSYQLVHGKNKAWVQNSTENFKNLKAEIERYISAPTVR